MFTYSPATFGKDYRLNELPHDSDGNVLYRGSSQEEYHAYVAWLADYLYNAPTDCGPRQAELCEAMQNTQDKEGAMWMLGMNAELYDTVVSDLEYAITVVLEKAGIEELAKITDEHLDQMQERYEQWEARGYWEDEEEDEEESLFSYDEEDNEEEENEDEGAPDVLYSQRLEATSTIEDFRAVIAEWNDAGNYFGGYGFAVENDYIDIGWRIPMAVLLHDVHDPAERIELVRRFFMSYQEYSRK